MKHLNETTNINIEESFDVSTGHHSVIQKGNVTKSNVYALQLWNDQNDIKVFKGPRSYSTNCNKLVFWGVNKAGHHTQTFEFANAGDQYHWFIGTKPVNNWCTQIARIDLTKQNVSSPHTTNLDFPRLAHLNQIGDRPYDGSLMYRVEAAVSPDYQKLLIMTVDSKYTAHFTFYDLPTINQALDEVESKSPQKRYVPMETQPLTMDSNFQSFSVDNFYNPNDVAGKLNLGSTDEITNSIQGVDIDNNGNIYISCQPSPSEVDGKYTGHHKQIIKIPSYAHNDINSWTSVNLSQYAKENPNTFDISNYHSEVESIQIISENYGYLTISYHNKNHLTTLSRIFETVK
uniref:helveticin J family class III bacteriocin n=2 Tax=Lactobacillus acidophilus TaxID=1579 RepID=UPI003F55A912